MELEIELNKIIPKFKAKCFIWLVSLIYVL